MIKNSTPPPTKYDELPDYYLGRLIVYEPLSTDKCRWVVYDGATKVRCYTRAEAVDYINQTVANVTSEQIQRLGRARYFVNKSILELDRAASLAVGADKLLLERLSVRLRPYLVEIDNLLSPYMYNSTSERQTP